MINTTVVRLNEEIVKPWPYRWLSCFGLGGLAMTFAMMAILSAILVSTQRSRSRRAKNLSLRDSMALIFLGGHLANFTLGIVAVWFGLENLHNFLPTSTCTSLVSVSVASQWNSALSIPTVAIYYAILIRFLDRGFQSTNQRREAGIARHNQRPRDWNREEEEARTSERNNRTRRCFTHLNGHQLFGSSVGVVILVCVVNVLTLVGVHYSLSEVKHVFTVNGIAAENSSSYSFCDRFLKNPELFPRRVMGIVFMISAAITAAAIFTLSVELDRKGKRRRRVVHSATPVDMTSIRSFTRPPDEGAHFHHYADPPHLPEPHRFGDGNDEVGHNEADVRPAVPAVEAEGARRLLIVGSDSAVEDVNSLGSSTTQMLWSDNEFYDTERTRHIVQSPPPPDFNIRANNRRTTHVLTSETEEHPEFFHTFTQGVLTLPNGSPTNPNWRTQRTRNLQETSRGGNLLSRQRGNSLDLTNDDFQRSTNENARPPLPIVQSSSSGSRTGQVSLPDANRHEVVERGNDNMWQRLVDLIFPHRQSGINRKRFSHTKVEHVREDILPPCVTSPPSRRVSMASTTPSGLPLPVTVTCHNVCVSGALFVLTYSIIAVYLLSTADVPLSKRQGFIDYSFEPYMALLLTKATLDSLFCFVALMSLSPMFLT